MTTENIDIQNEEVEDQISNPTSDDVQETDGTISNPTVEETDTEDVDTTDTPDDDQDSFPRSYVEKLRDENAKYRQRAQRSDDLAQRLHTALVEGTGLLQDPTDLAFDEAHLDDPDALQAAIDDLVATKPHLAARRPFGDVGQGQTGSSNTVDLAGILRARA